MASTAADGSAAPTRSIVLRAPEGEVGWTLIELQGAMEARSGSASLDGVEFGKLVREVCQHVHTRPPPFFLILHACAEIAARKRGRRVSLRSW